MITASFTVAILYFLAAAFCASGASSCPRVTLFLSMGLAAIAFGLLSWSIAQSP